MTNVLILFIHDLLYCFSLTTSYRTGLKQEQPLKMEVKQSVKFTLFSKLTSTLITNYITNMINVTILKKKGCFVIAFGAQAPPSCSITACRDGQYFKYMYLKYVFEIQNTILYCNTIEINQMYFIFKYI